MAMLSVVSWNKSFELGIVFFTGLWYNVKVSEMGHNYEI